MVCLLQILAYLFHLQELRLIVLLPFYASIWTAVSVTVIDCVEPLLLTTFKYTVALGVESSLNPITDGVNNTVSDEDCVMPYTTTRGRILSD